jgi:hypothetical protein
MNKNIADFIANVIENNPGNYPVDITIRIVGNIVITENNNNLEISKIEQVTSDPIVNEANSVLNELLSGFAKT